MEEGKVICSQCKGKKVVIEYPSEANPRLRSPLIEECSKCNGKGELDWVSNIMGKGKVAVAIKPGRYVREVDLSVYVPKSEEQNIDITLLDRG